MPDDRVASTLAEWGKLTRAATIGPWEKLGPDDIWSQPAGRHVAETMNREADAEFIVTARIAMPVLLAALEAVLKLADDWDGKAEAFTAAASRDGGPSRMTRAMLNARVQVLQDCAQALREAITAALLGEGAGDEK